MSTKHADLIAKVYPVTLYFTRKFTKGNLKGLVHHDSLPFVSVDSAEVWRKAVTAKGIAGKLPYQIVDASYQCYTR